MDEIEVLKKISSNLTARKGSAALSNYKVLCNNIAFLNRAFFDAIELMRIMHKKTTAAAQNDTFFKYSIQVSE